MCIPKLLKIIHGRKYFTFESLRQLSQVVCELLTSFPALFAEYVECHIPRSQQDFSNGPKVLINPDILRLLILDGFFIGNMACCSVLCTLYFKYFIRYNFNDILFHK